MYLKLRMSKTTKNEIQLYKEKTFEANARITPGYLIGLAINEPIVETLTADKFAKFKKTKNNNDESEKQSTTLTISQEVNGKLKALQEKLNCPNPALTIEFLMAAVAKNVKDNVTPGLLMENFIEKDKNLTEKNLYERNLEHYIYYKDNNCIDDYENTEENIDILNELGINGQYRDIINPFWNVYFSYLAISSKEKKTDLFIFSDNNKSVKMDTAPAKAYPDYRYIDKKIHSKEVLSVLGGGFANRTKDKEEIYKQASHDPLIEKLIKAVYCLANVTDIPDYQFNVIKGYKAWDYLPLMIDLIEKHIAEDKPIECNGKVTDVKTLKEWKQFFIENRESRKLNDWYYISSMVNGEKKLVGIPLFAAQSLDHPLPTNKDELEECIDNISAIYLHRSKLLPK